MEQNFGKSGEQHEKELGAVCICALACYKATGDSQHPLVTKAVAQIREELQAGMKHTGHANYSLGIAMIFLGELAPDLYRQEIQEMLEEVYKRQMPYGAWSYPNDPLGDVSQTQYAVLGMWLADRQGTNVDRQAIERVCNWLLRVQEPDGVFPYKGRDPGNFTRITQEKQSSASMCAAAVGSLYVCGELLGFIDSKKFTLHTRLPPAIRPVKAQSGGSIAVSVDKAIWQTGVNDGNNWMNRNSQVENFDEFHKKGYQQYYYMYGIERYWAFRELAEGIDTKEPAWYNDGVEHLRKQQSPNGSWHSTRGVSNGPVIDTGFAVMFLLRSSKETLTKLVNGIMIGHKGGLSADMSSVELTKSGKVVRADAMKATSELLAMLEDKSQKDEFESEVPDKFELSAKREERTGQFARIRRLLIDGPYKARLAAAKTLGTIRDLDNGPYLIFALSDPDRRVVRAARDSLRFISRKPQGFEMVIPDGDPREPIEKPIVVKAQQDWTNWLLSVIPDAELVE